MSNTMAVTDANFATEIEGASGLAVVDFWAEWCGPCRMVGPIVDQLATEYAGKAKVTKLDVDANQQTAMKSLDHARIHMAAVAVGLSARLIDEGVRYASERRQFGKPIAQFQLIQAMLADSEAEAFAARSMVEKAACDKDAGFRITKESACAKYFATEALWRIADRVMQIHSGYGYIKEYPVERLFRDARLLRIYEGTSQIQQLIIAKEMLRERGTA